MDKKCFRLDRNVPWRLITLTAIHIVSFYGFWLKLKTGAYIGSKNNLLLGCCSPFDLFFWAHPLISSFELTLWSLFLSPLLSSPFELFFWAFLLSSPSELFFLSSPFELLFQALLLSSPIELFFRALLLELQSTRSLVSVDITGAGFHSCIVPKSS